MDNTMTRRLGFLFAGSLSFIVLLWLGFRNSARILPESSIDRLGEVVTHEDGIPLPTAEVSPYPELEESEQASIDFDQYTLRKTISSKLLGLNDTARRVFIIGDVHGMKRGLDDLLQYISYEQSHDTLIHLGDIVSKGPASLSVLEFMSKNRVYGVRGNHDQKVIAWRAWQNWVESKPSGKEWLKKAEMLAAKEFKKEQDISENRQRKGWTFPDDWKWSSEHYWIARNMTSFNYEYLLSLPLVLHIPSLHTFVVHAGLVPFDPRNATVSLSETTAFTPTPATLEAAELAVLENVPQNQDPWALLNMRSILEHGEPSRKYDGTPWSDVWNDVQAHCKGYAAKDSEKGEDAVDGESLRCTPSTVVYGHAAALGLDIKRWTKGLDSGCVYGRQLTGLALGKLDMVHGEEIILGNRPAKLAVVDCV